MDWLVWGGRDQHISHSYGICVSVPVPVPVSYYVCVLITSIHHSHHISELLNFDLMIQVWYYKVELHSHIHY